MSDETPPPRDCGTNTSPENDNIAVQMGFPSFGTTRRDTWRGQKRRLGGSNVSAERDVWAEPPTPAATTAGGEGPVYHQQQCLTVEAPGPGDKGDKGNASPAATGNGLIGDTGSVGSHGHAHGYARRSRRGRGGRGGGRGGRSQQFGEQDGSDAGYYLPSFGESGTSTYPSPPFPWQGSACCSFFFIFVVGRLTRARVCSRRPLGSLAPSTLITLMRPAAPVVGSCLAKNQRYGY